MPKVTTTFSITIGPMPVWYPGWSSPGVITAIPNSTLEAAIAANGWRADDPVSGGTDWPMGLYAFSGGTVVYLAGQPYYAICGGGHGTHADNSIYAFGPLFGTGADAPEWTRIGAQSATADLRTCVQHNADGRPTSRHTVGDFSYGLGSDGKGRIVMLWKNSVYCGNGGTSAGIDVFDVDAREWDNAKNPAVTHGSHPLDPETHAMSAYHPHTGLWYGKGKGGRSGSFGSYDPVTRNFTPINYTGYGSSYDSAMTAMGPRNYLYFCKGPGDQMGRVNVSTGVAEQWGNSNFPSGSGKAVAYDSLQDRLYIPTPGVAPLNTNRNMPAGSPTVSWLDASASSNPSWVAETFSGDTPDQQQIAGTFGRWSFVPELKGFLLNNAHDSPIYLYRTSE